MFEEMQIPNGGGSVDTEPSYIEYVICSGHSGYGWGTGGKPGSVSGISTSYEGDYLRSYLSGNYFCIGTVSTLVGEVEVEYWSSAFGSTPTLNKGTFTAGQQITSILYTSSRVNCFAAVLK